MPDDPETRPWLNSVDDQQAARILGEFAEFLFRPAFGAQSKREIELKVFELLYGERIATGGIRIGEIAEQLGVPRSRARNLVLESRSRRMAQATAQEREEILRRAVLKWPAHGLEMDQDRFKVLVEDPFVRDVLKTYSYARGIVLDRALSSDLVALSWPTYERLLTHLTSLPSSDIDIFAAEARRSLMVDEKQKKAFEKEIARLRRAGRTPDERRRDFVEAVKKWAPAVGTIAKTAASTAA